MKKVVKFFSDYKITVLIFIGVIIGYILLTEFELIDTYMFPTVDKIGREFMKNIDVMFLNMFSSFGLVLPSIFYALVIALSVGMLLGLNKKIRKTLNPIVYAFSVIPALLLAPFALMLAPSFKSASIFLIVYATIWPTLFATVTGFQTIDQTYLDKADTLEIHGLKRLINVTLPAASPSILSGFVSSLRSSFLVLVYAEMYDSEYGMGYFVKISSELGIYDRTWAGFLFMVVVLVIVMQFFEKGKAYILRWTN